MSATTIEAIQSAGTVLIEDRIISILSAKPVSGLRVGQIRARLRNADVSITSMQLSIIIQRMCLDGAIVRCPSLRDRNFRYLLRG